MKTAGVLACLLIFGCGSSPKPPAPAPAPAPAPTDVAAAPTTTTTAAPAPAPAPAPGGAKSLYDRLGGLPAITAVVGAFVANDAADPRINQRFFNTDIENLKKLLTEFVCMATGGPCKYS